MRRRTTTPSVPAAMMTAASCCCFYYAQAFTPSLSSSSSSSMMMMRMMMTTSRRTIKIKPATTRFLSSVSLSSSSSSSASSFLGDYRMRILTSSSSTSKSKSNHSRSTKNHNRSSYSSSCLKMMPEGPEVRTLVDQLQGGIGKRLRDINFLTGRYLKQRPVGFPEFAHTMTPLRIPSNSNLNSKSPQDDQPSQQQQQQSTTTSIDTILDINCKGKFIYMLLDNGNGNGNNNDTTDDPDSNDNENDNENENDFQRSIWITLGMTGRFVNESRHVHDPDYGRWFLELVDTQHNNSVHRIYYHDKRNFGTVKFCLSRKELDTKLKSLGPDVLAVARDDINPIIDEESQLVFLGILAKQRNQQMNICKFLMDQKKIAGVGNYILSEVLYRADIDPFCGLDELSKVQRLALWEEIKNVSYESYTSQQQSQFKKSQATPERSLLSTTTTTTGGSSSSITLSPDDGYTSVEQLQEFEFELQCYKAKVCPQGNPVLRDSNGPHGRTIWYTEQQLFMPRSQREKQTNEQQQSKTQSKATTTATIPINNNNNDDNSDDQRINIAPLSSSSSSSSSSLRQLMTDTITDPGWKNALESYISSESSASSSSSFPQLDAFLQQEYDTYGAINIYPPRHEIFHALNLCPLHKVKVVIVGQDPYHGPKQAMGLSFSVNHGITVPPSLRNIFKEMQTDIGADPHHHHQQQQQQAQHGDLVGWAQQGVLLLNTVLTVRCREANSHKNQGWEQLTDEIVRIVLTRKLEENTTTNNGTSTSTSNGLVFLLWGGPATKKAQAIIAQQDRDESIDETVIDKKKKNTVVVITTSHPSPLGATKTKTPFLGSNCFSRTNAALQEMGLEPIDWYQR